MRKRLELTTKGGKCGGSSSILSFKNYNHEKRCTKGGEVLSCISFHLSARRPRTLLPAARKGLRPRSGEKIFTEGGGGNRLIAGNGVAVFAPRRPQRLTASFRGAKSSHKAAAEIALSPARRPPTLLPAARKGLRLRIGEQNLHTKRRRKSLYHRLAGRRFCSPPPTKAYGFVPGSKKFTEGGGGKRLIAGSPAADFAPRRPQRLTASSRGAKSSHKAAAEIALLPARIPFLRYR